MLREGMLSMEEAGAADSEAEAVAKQTTARTLAATGTPGGCAQPKIFDSQHAQLATLLGGPGLLDSGLILGSPVRQRPGWSHGVLFKKRDIMRGVKRSDP